MDVSNDHLKYLFERTDVAFKALLREPDSAELNQAYESAKNELDSYIAVVRHSMTSG